MSYVSVDIGWQDVTFKFDGFLTGLGELADKIINQLGLGRLMLAKQKRWESQGKICRDATAPLKVVISES